MTSNGIQTKDKNRENKMKDTNFNVSSCLSEYNKMC